MRALITGACGFAGGHLGRHLLACGDQVLGGIVRPVAEGTPFATTPLDVTDAAQVRAVLSSFKPEVVYHLAGLAFVPDAEEDFDLALRVNVAGTHNVLRTCHLLQRQICVVVVSSAEVYGKCSAIEGGLTEATPLHPANNYSLTKVMAEAIVPRYTALGQLRAVIVRPFNHIGPGQSDRFVASSFARQLALIKAGKSPAVLRVGNLAARRDFSDVRDIVRGYRLAAHAGEGIFNLCSGKACAIQEILDRLIEISGVPVRVEQDAARMRASDVAEVTGSYAHAQQELGWRPERPLRESLEDLFEYWCGIEMAVQ